MESQSRAYTLWLRLFWCCMFSALFFILITEEVLLGTVVLVIGTAYACYRFELPKFPFVLFILSLALKLAVVFTVHTPLMSDFKEQFEAAKQLLVGDTSFQQDAYYQTWAGQTGLVIFEAFLLRIWNSIVVIKLVNALAAALLNVLVYALAKEFTQKKAAQCVSLFYMVFVFHATYVSVLSNQPTSTAIVFLGFYLLIAKKFESWNVAAKYALVGLLFAIANALRPDGVMVIVTFAAYIVFGIFQNSGWKGMLHYGQRAAALIGMYVLVSWSLSQLVIAAGVNAAGLSTNGYTMKFVYGLNHATSGQNSRKDFEEIERLVKEKGIRSEEAQRMLIQQRLQVSPFKMAELMKEKTRIFWWERAIGWSLGHIRQSASKLYSWLLDLDKAMFTCILGLAALGMARRCRQKNNGDNGKWLLLPFYVFATFAVYLLIEVQPRYAYAAQVALFILAAAGVEAFAAFYGTLKTTLIRSKYPLETAARK